MEKPTTSTRYKVDPIVPVVLIIIGIAVVSMVFGVMLFPILTQVCADELLYAIAKMGYFGAFLIFSGLMLEAYHLYEEHKRHISVLITVSLIVVIITCWLINLLANHYSC